MRGRGPVEEVGTLPRKGDVKSAVNKKNPPKVRANIQYQLRREALSAARSCYILFFSISWVLGLASIAITL